MPPQKTNWEELGFVEAPESSIGFTSTAAETGRLNIGQTTIGPQRTFLERTAGAAPEFVGQIGGGVIGAAAGGMPGAITGGGIGGAGGESVRQLLGRLGIWPRAFGTGEETSQEAAMKIGGAGAFGAITELPGAFLARQPFKRVLTPDQLRDIGLLKREGIPFSAGDIRPTHAAQQIENLMRGTLLGAKRASQFEQTQRRMINEFQQRILDKMGPLLSAEETGQALQNVVRGRHQQLVGQGGIFERAYRKVSQLFPADVDSAVIRKQVAPIKAELDKITAEGRIGAAAKSKEAPSRFLDLVDRLSRFGTASVPPTPPSTILGPTGQPIRAAIPATRKEIPLTYSDVWQDKQSLDALIRTMGPDDPLRTKAKGLLNRLHGILDNAMETAAQKVSPQAAQRIRSVNQSYAEMKKLFETESLVADVGKMDSERVVQRFFAPGAVTGPKELLKAVQKNPGILPPLRRRVVENLFEGIGREVEGVRVTPANQLRERIVKAKSQLDILLTKEQRGALHEFVNAATRAQASGRMLNPASGRQLLAMSQLGNAAQLIGAGYFISGGNIPGAAAAIFGPAVLSRAILNPKVAKLLAEGFTIKPGTIQATAWGSRALNALRIYEREEESATQSTE